MADETYSGPERRIGYPPASQQEVADMRRQQEGLDRSVRGLHSQLRSLDATLRDFVPRREIEQTFSAKRDVERHDREVTRRRRLLGGSLGLSILVAIQLHDLHIEQCRPVSAGEIGAPRGLALVGCDLAFPTHSHAATALAGELSLANVIGVAIWLALLAALVVVVVRNWPHSEDS